VPDQYVAYLLVGQKTYFAKNDEKSGLEKRAPNSVALERPRVAEGKAAQ